MIIMMMTCELFADHHHHHHLYQIAVKTLRQQQAATQDSDTYIQVTSAGSHSQAKYI